MPADKRAIGERLGIGRTAEVHAWGADRVVNSLRPGFLDRLGEAEAEAAALVREAVAAFRASSVPRVGG